MRPSKLAALVSLVAVALAGCGVSSAPSLARASASAIASASTVPAGAVSASAAGLLPTSAPSFAASPTASPAHPAPFTTIEWGGSVAGTSTVPNCRARDALGDCLLSMTSTAPATFCTRVPGSPRALRFSLGSTDPKATTVDIVIPDTTAKPPALEKMAIRLAVGVPLRDVVVGLGDVTKFDVVDGGDHATISVSATAANGDTLTAAIACDGVNP